MKKPIIIPFIITLCTGITLFSGCEPEEVLDTSSKDAFITSIANTWAIDENSQVEINDQDITEVLMGFEMTINEDLTFTTNSDQLTIEEFPWPTSGSFALNDELTVLTRDDGLVINLDLSEDESELLIVFEADENTGGRTLGIRGGWRCHLSRR
ncbi:MAG: hypothetical protein ABJF04_24475 [Reichenbachiella sp.]|uniref:hypothetical protein n=1 Tax=Reichenbachiella sp. TaxID=2184521 RepID=UPI003264738E